MYPFPKEKQFSGLFFLDANIANALLIMSLIMKNLFHRNFKGKGKKDCGKMQGKKGKKFWDTCICPEKYLYLGQIFRKKTHFLRKKITNFVPKNGLFQDRNLTKILCNLLMIR